MMSTCCEGDCPEERATVRVKLLKRYYWLQNGHVNVVILVKPWQRQQSVLDAGMKVGSLFV